MVTLTGTAAAEHAMASGTIDVIDGHPLLFNPKCADMSFNGALNEHQSTGNDLTSSDPSVYRKFDYVAPEDLNNFQQNARELVTTPEDPVPGRKVIVIVDEEGGIGKSMLVKTLHRTFPGGVVIFCGVNMTNNLNVLTAWCDAHGGRGPALIIVDPPRSTAAGMDHGTLETSGPCPDVPACPPLPPPLPVRSRERSCTRCHRTGN